MPRSKKGSPPSYRRHSGGQACVSVRDRTGRRREILLGRYDSPDSRHQYERVLAVLKVHHGYYPFENDAGGRNDTDGLTVDQVILEWWKDAERRLGEGSKELAQYRYALRYVRTLYGSSPAAAFSPKRFKTVRQRMVEALQYLVKPVGVDGAKPRWLPEYRVKVQENVAQLKDGEWHRVEVLGSRQAFSRKVINRNLVRVRAVFSWAVSEELIPASVAHGLREVKGVQQGDRQVKESKPQSPAFWADVERVLPHCTRPVAAMLHLQWFTGMRSAEVRAMRTVDIDRTDPQVWEYRPGSDAGPYGAHKNAWRGQTRVVALGPACIEVLKPWINDKAPLEYLFQPRLAVAEVNARRRRDRKSPRWPSHVRTQEAKRSARPKRPPGACYSDSSYPQAVARACARAGVKFNPYALRHGRKMAVAREFGSDAARAVLGQKSIDATEHYGEIDQAHAREVMKKLG
jgi:integrase